MKQIGPDTVLFVSMSFVLVFLVALNILHFGDGWALNQREWWRDVYELVNAVGINLLAAYFFYVLIAYFFVNRRRGIIKANLQVQYRQFKKSVIGHFLGAVPDVPYHPDLVNQLFDVPKFRTFFQEVPPHSSENRWSMVFHAVHSSSILQRELIMEINELRDEIMYLLSAIEIYDENIFGFFKSLKQITYRLQHDSIDTGKYEQMLDVLYQAFAGWNNIDGKHRDTDFVQSFIDDL